MFSVEDMSIADVGCGGGAALSELARIASGNNFLV